MSKVIVLAVLALLTASACGGGSGASSARTTPPQPTAIRTTAAATPTAATAPTSTAPATLEGTLTVDGAPLDAQFVGARVLRGGLSAACQDAIPSVTAGQYRIPVTADGLVRGCGATGADIVLWTYYKDAYLFTSERLPWPGSGTTTRFDATFSTSTPLGATTAVTGFKGHLFDSAGVGLPAGTVVESYVGDTLCGVTSLRPGDSVEGYYTLTIAGPASVPACAFGAQLTFRLDGKPAAETAFNDLGIGTRNPDVLDLKLK